MRGLLWLWGDVATPAVLCALADDAWRVREMAARVAARHQIDAALEVLVMLREDPVARVRAEAARAIQNITNGSG